MLSSFIHALLDPRVLISALGTSGVIAIVFMETGLFFGFFFPGDSLLFTAGFLVTQGYISLGWLLAGAFVAAVLGDSIGYAFGRRVGPSLFTKDDSAFFDKGHIARAEHFYEKYGAKTIILARFIPIVRTFAPIVAGIGNMRYRTFVAFNVIGALAWTWLMIFLGYSLGSLIPDPDRYVLPIIMLIIVISAIPPILEVVRRKKQAPSS